MIKSSKFVKDLKYMANNMVTRYSNVYPYNCGWIGNGFKSYDCIGLIKSYINKPDEFLSIAPIGDYVVPGQVIPDGYDEIGILTSCSNVSVDFGNILPGEYMYMNGHAGVYVGEYKDSSGIVNTVECTTDWECNGVITTYVDGSGRRFNHRGGLEMRSWEKHGRMDTYIEYEECMISDEHAKKLLKAAIDVIDGDYSVYPYRENLLISMFGKSDAKKIQNIVNLAYEEG